MGERFLISELMYVIFHSQFKSRFPLRVFFFYRVIFILTIPTVPAHSFFNKMRSNLLSSTAACKTGIDHKSYFIAR